MIFDGFDKDGNGSIDKEELFEAFVKLDVKVSKDQINQVFDYLDKDDSGALDYSEFLTLYHLMKEGSAG